MADFKYKTELLGGSDDGFLYAVHRIPATAEWSKTTLVMAATGEKVETSPPIEAPGAMAAIAMAKRLGQWS